MASCGHEGCLHHAYENRYGRRSLLCRLSIHRHWEDSRSDSPPPWHNDCLLCGYSWIRRLNALPSEYGREPLEWWRKAPWYIRRPMWALLFWRLRRA